MNQSSKLPAHTHILVVEDEEHLATGIRFNLEAEGYQVTVATDGQTALKHVDEHPGVVDLVILDLMLPGMSGYEVCETLRAKGEEMPILILSARTLPEDRTRGFDLGADQYMMKPFDLDEFLSRVKNLFAIRNRSRKQIVTEQDSLKQITIGTATVNFETHQVTSGDQTVRLTQLESKLLLYFCENENRIIPRNELLENIWEMPGNINTRAPDQFIRRLRKMFEVDPSQPQHFITIRDAGYQFIGDQEAVVDESDSDDN
ncbi:MAG: response regulator transcription factor [Pirellulales bacterium]|jgi:DNA-binding response OmpR family regulator